MNPFSDYLQTNLNRWNELAPLHLTSDFYDVEGFKAGKNALMPLEREELGDVSGKTLLHLQCHFGLDTLSWARLGAQVTGVDFSDQAIRLAQLLSQELGIEARFVCSNLYDLKSTLISEFDIVFTSYGALCWLPDLKEWAQIVAHFLKPGGTFYIAEIHPLALIFDDSKEVKELKVGYSYFPSSEPLECIAEGSYADPNAQVKNRKEYVWIYTIGDVLNSLIEAGLKIEFFHEFPYCVYPAFPGMEQCGDGWWRFKNQPHSIPFLFSLKATK